MPTSKTIRIQKRLSAKLPAAARPDSPRRRPAVPQPPAWALSTPDDIDYRLTMYDSGGDEAESITDITRDEYIKLKECLAKTRGIPFKGWRPSIVVDSERLATLLFSPDEKGAV